jgi:hypothetical protein
MAMYSILINMMLAISSFWRNKCSNNSHDEETNDLRYLDNSNIAPDYCRGKRIS